MRIAATTTAGLLASASIVLAAPMPSTEGTVASHSAAAPSAPQLPKRSTRCKNPIVRKEWYAYLSVSEVVLSNCADSSG
jgi:hypothetical protein